MSVLADPDWGPYALLLLAGVLPNAIWRVAGVFAARGLREDSELIVFVRCVANALLAAVVAKLLISPPGQLASIAFVWRAGAVAAGLVAYWLFDKKMAVGVVAGVGAVMLAGWLGL